MYFLQSIFCIFIDWVNRKILVNYNKKFIFLSHFYLLYFTVYVIITNFFCIKIEKTNLCLNEYFVFLSKDWISFLCVIIFRESNSEYSIKWIKFYLIEMMSSNNLPLLYFFFFILNKRAPSENVLFDLVLFTLIFLKENES